ncbi:hypothetical protein WJX75_000552 [Coccomyxa subellipsoidea]|uniref:LITAF domain-containing protein n=1 Tax=Coccomyxa subellipsoidea TaxID=248742 RepID=A0ABR2YEJ3_9CHLO
MQPQGPQPIPGVNVRPPLVPPAAGQVVTHFETFTPQTGCCKCDGMKMSGYVAIILLVIFFWPLAFIPCLMDDCFEPQQRPVYGYAQGQAPIPVAQPAHGQPAHGEPVYTKATEPPV